MKTQRKQLDSLKSLDFSDPTFSKEINGGYKFGTTTNYGQPWQGTAPVTKIEFVEKAKKVEKDGFLTRLTKFFS